jgi:uncharacterized protein YheU (UPF0270 family)
MGAVKIPVDRLTPETLQGVVEEFITREGTDYGKIEVPLDTKLRQVKNLLESGMAVLIYDTETQTCNIFPADDPVVKSLEG